ncbi:hypothetical protein SERLADRAFT_443358 [Serpula lacrymans var. lacrymans S7.9]|uniref:Uncharacterized protein n=1 Tax=Serpula lacrymans var. lacrymans (strain S7.9) TaxID=578457 RepID=F8PCA8_SERL9|nr:uncharacterized protein SERLADRAFT_443358 [Serpula lacrymans var. lacrymans S7.9]EGO19308.1 hypothetical protein SERLADRAFT_443358 [Serpula lacrymans var. lacrymans S7.9]
MSKSTAILIITLFPLIAIILFGIAKLYVYITKPTIITPITRPSTIVSFFPANVSPTESFVDIPLTPPSNPVARTLDGVEPDSWKRPARGYSLGITETTVRTSVTIL